MHYRGFMSCYITRLPNLQKYLPKYEVSFITCSVLCGWKCGTFVIVLMIQLPVLSAYLIEEHQIIKRIINLEICDSDSLHKIPKKVEESFTEAP